MKVISLFVIASLAVFATASPINSAIDNIITDGPITMSVMPSGTTVIIHNATRATPIPENKIEPAVHIIVTPTPIPEKEDVNPRMKQIM